MQNVLAVALQCFSSAMSVCNPARQDFMPLQTSPVVKCALAAAHPAQTQPPAQLAVQDIIFQARVVFQLAHQEHFQMYWLVLAQFVRPHVQFAEVLRTAHCALLVIFCNNQPANPAKQEHMAPMVTVQRA